MRYEMCGLIRMALVVLLLSTGLMGCNGKLWGGAAAGAVGAGAVYEYQNRSQLEQLEEDFQRGLITREEYLRRKREIEKGSIIY